MTIYNHIPLLSNAIVFPSVCLLKVVNLAASAQNAYVADGWEPTNGVTIWPASRPPVDAYKPMRKYFLKLKQRKFY